MINSITLNNQNKPNKFLTLIHSKPKFSGMKINSILNFALRYEKEIIIFDNKVRGTTNGFNK